MTEMSKYCQAWIFSGSLLVFCTDVSANFTHSLRGCSLWIERVHGSGVGAGWLILAGGWRGGHLLYKVNSQWNTESKQVKKMCCTIIL